MINFTYHNPTRIVFGKDQINALDELMRPYQGKTVLLVYGRQSIKDLGIYEQIQTTLGTLDITVIEEAGVRPNPSMESVLSGRRKCLAHGVDFVLAAGGGSVLDAAKAIAFAATLEEADVWRVFLRETDAQRALPIGTVLTLAATGSEANGNTVITNDDTDEKRSVAYSFLFPVFSIIDPAYTQSVNEHYTIAGSVDVMMHVFEQYFSPTERTETSDYMALGVVKSVIENTERIRQGEDDYQTRANISWAATLGLNWLLQAGKVGDWASHRLSYPITQRVGLTHGFALSAIFPAWLQTALKHNPEVMERRLAFLGRELFDDDNPARAIDHVRDVFKRFGAPVTLKEAGCDLDESTLDYFVNNALALGPVGTVIEIDDALARELFLRAR